MRRYAVTGLFALACASPALAAESGWTIAEAAPGVVIEHAGHAAAAHVGQRISTGDVVITDAAAHAVLIAGERRAELEPGSRLLVAGDAGGVDALAGAIAFHSAGAAQLVVRTRYLTAIAGTTRFSLTVDDRGATVQVADGLVDLATTDGGAQARAAPGETARVYAANPKALRVGGARPRLVRSDVALLATMELARAAVPRAAVVRRDMPVKPMTGAAIQADGAVLLTVSDQ